MKDAYELQDINDFIESGAIRILYFSRPSCGVCIAVRPKVEEMLAGYPEAEAIYIDLEKVPDASGRFSVYSLPGVLLYVNGKESLRIARYFAMDDLQAPLERYYNLMYN